MQKIRVIDTYRMTVEMFCAMKKHWDIRVIDIWGEIRVNYLGRERLRLRESISCQLFSHLCGNDFGLPENITSDAWPTPGQVPSHEIPEYTPKELSRTTCRYKTTSPFPVHGLFHFFYNHRDGSHILKRSTKRRKRDLCLKRLDISFLHAQSATNVIHSESGSSGSNSERWRSERSM